MKNYANGISKIKSQRECAFIIDLVNHDVRFRGLAIDFPLSNSSVLPDNSIQILRHWIYEQNKKGNGELLTLVFEEMGKEMLPEDQFQWIKSSGDRALFFLATTLFHENGGLTSISSVLTGKEYWFAIYSYFDQQLTSIGLASDLDAKQRIMKQFEVRFSHAIKSRGLPVEKMDREQLEWALNYLKNTKSNPLLQQIDPVSDRELKIAINGYIDLCPLPEDSKALMLHKLRAAWASKRSRSNDKRNLNCRLDEGIFNQLTKLAKKNRCSKTEMIERLIEDAIKG